MKLICSYCNKRSTRLIKCKDCKDWLCPVCINEGKCPEHLMIFVEAEKEYFEEKYAEKT